MVRSLSVRSGIAVWLVACLLAGWTGRVSADTANTPNPKLQIYQLPKDAIDPIYKGGTSDGVPNEQGGTSDGPPSSENAPSDDVNNGDGYDGDGNTTNNAPSNKPKIGPSITIPLQEIIESLTKPHQPPTLPDLTFGAAAGKFDEAARRVTLSFCVVNAGQGGSNATTVSIRDRASQAVVDSPKIAALPSGGKACRDDISASVPAGFAGARQYDLTVDPQQLVKESNEDNNTELASVDIKPLIDLKVANAAARFDPATRRVTFSFCVANASKSASGDTEVSIRDGLTNDTVGKVPIGPLSPDSQTCRKDISAAAPAGFNGARQYVVMVDPQDLIPESDENNNTSSATANIKAQPDLAVANAGATFDEAARRATLSFCVLNSGDVPVKQTTVSIRDRATATTLASPTMGPIAARGQVCLDDQSVTVPIEASGKQRYDVIVDPKNKIAESDETNNTASVAINVRSLPDLVFTESTATFDEAARQVALSFCVANRGKGAAGDSEVSIRDRVADSAVWSGAVGPLSADGSACRKDLRASIPNGFSGARQYDLIADSSGKISESDETNNASSVTITVSAPPDLSFTDATAKFDQAASDLVLSFCVINNGGTASNENRVSIRDPSTGGEVANLKIAPLDPSRRTCRDGLLMPVTAGYSGTRHFDLTVDPDGKVAESDEDNNAASAEASVSMLANLSFAEASGSFDEATREAMLSFCIVNNGQAPSNETAVSIQDSAAGALADTPKIGALSPGSQSCLRGLAIPVADDYSGTRHYALTVDPQDATKESNEGDNTGSISVLVPAVAVPLDTFQTAAAEPAAAEPVVASGGTMRIALVTIVGLAVLAGGIVLFVIMTRRGKTLDAPAPQQTIRFRARPDLGTQVVHSVSADIVLPSLHLRGHVDPGHQRIEMQAVAAE